MKELLGVMWVAETGCEPRSENSGTTALTSMPSSLVPTGVTRRLSKIDDSGFSYRSSF